MCFLQWSSLDVDACYRSPLYYKGRGLTLVLGKGVRVRVEFLEIIIFNRKP